jgi:predicted esterase
MTLRRCLPLIFAVSAIAQDAGMALRTSVGYNTQRASLPLTDEQKKQAEQLGRDAQRETQAGRYGEAMRKYHQGTAVMRGLEWTPALELASSLQAHLDHAMVESGQKVTVTLSPLYPAERAAAEKINAVVVLRAAMRPGGQNAIVERNIAAAAPLDPGHLPFMQRITVPDVPAGDYTVIVRLEPVEGIVPNGARTTFDKDAPIHVEALAAQAQRLRDRLAKLNKRDSTALPTAQFVLARYEQTDHGDLSPLRYNFGAEFAGAHAILDAVEAGRDPFAGKRGDMRRAYLSKVDNTFQPYRLLVPDKYDGTKATPLLVALHGMGGDENSMFDGYRETLKAEAQRVGFIVACPKGRDSASMYRGSAEQDVLDVIAEVRRDYKIDDSRIYMMGHSMGGFGTWSVAMDHPELFAGLGPISGGGNPASLEKIKSIPEYIVHGDDDKTVNVNQSRMMVEAGKKMGVPMTYVEIPGGSHVSVAEPQFAPMLDFFVKQSKSK